MNRFKKESRHIGSRINRSKSPNNNKKKMWKKRCHFKEKCRKGLDCTFFHTHRELEIFKQK